MVAEKGLKTFLKRHYFSGHPEEVAKRQGTPVLSGIDKLIAAMVTALPDIIGLFVFFVAAYFSYFTFIWTKSPYLQLLFLSLLLTISLTRVIAIVSHLIFSPAAEQFRLLSVSNQNARVFHRFLVGTGMYFITALMFTAVTFRLGAERITVSLLAIFFATILLAVAAILVVIYKRRMETYLLGASSGPPSLGRKKFAALCHVPALIYLFLIWILFVNTVDSPQQTNSRAAFIISFFMLPLWLIADMFIQWMVRFLMMTLKIHDENLPIQDTSISVLASRRQGRLWFGRCNIAARACLIFALGIWLICLWGIHVPLISQFTEVFFDSALILALSLLLWQFISTWIERKIAESVPEGSENISVDDEWGAAAAYGRSYTLLPMVRKFVGSILVVMVAMTVLSAMGVDIGPLLAGAGVIGLAIGFGSQKLVADIFSGFFYLLDDAFRVGEYLEAGAVSGTVENITLRNVMLRHHRGMLQIVPHSQLGAVTNFMRGGIVVKFNLDFPYDADIDKIRKVIKKVGQEMMTDEEFGKNFIKPVKSQGVREITNSVMTIRVKFTSQPGAHFVIRREAYKRITEALKTKDIQYAHRKVIVDLPGAVDAEGISKQQIKAAGAAALLEMDTLQESQRL
ncbi:MAG: mechanosensitive ion channel domain-containing protein [Desulforhopalus sp.]